MSVIQKSLKLNVKEYYTTHLNIINSIFPKRLTDKEIEILSEFMSLDISITGVDMFNTYARKIIKENLKMSSGSLSNHLKSMLDKDFLTKDKITNRISVREFLLPNENWQGYQFKIIKQVNEVK